MHSRRFALGVVAALASTFAVASAHATLPAHTIRVATPFAAGHILADTANKFKEVLEERTQGRITVQVSTSVLNEQTINPAMTSCTASERVADIMLTGGQPIQDYAPAYFFFNGPYVIRDYDHFQAVWASHLGDEARALILAASNLESLGTVYRGFRQFTSNSPIDGPGDFVALKLRLPSVPDWIAVWSSLGAVPVQVPLTGIYAALQNGTADASEGDLTQIRSLNLHEVQSHLSLTSHLVGFGLVMANECFLADLPEGDERRVRRAMRKAVRWGSRNMEKREATLLTELESLGMEVVTPDAAAIRAAAEPAIDHLFATKWTVTTWAEVLSF